jgi:imidazole glycerol phosphate synthase glutamine amidotransferase subunit
VTDAPAPDAEVVIVRTGSANVASVRAAFDRLGVRTQEDSSPDAVLHAPALVLPGVGHFGPAMRTLRERTLDDALRERVRLGRPLLAICLGLQVLCETSEEAPGEAGLAIIPGGVRKFTQGVRVPHMGWNLVRPPTDDDASAMLRESAMYFANSYRLIDAPPGWRCAISDHAGPFVAAIERGPILACQFHPELSGSAGRALLARWLAKAGVRNNADALTANRPSRANPGAPTHPTLLTPSASVNPC